VNKLNDFICPVCKEVNEEHRKYCKQCGTWLLSTTFQATPVKKKTIAGNSKLKSCKTCEKQVAKSANVCPHCGAKLKMGVFKKLLIGVAALFVIALLSNVNEKPATQTASSPSSNSKSAETPKELSKEGVSSDVKIVVQNVETKDTVGNNQFSKANAQGVFKVIKLRLTNNQKSAITVDSSSFKLVDSQGREFSHSTDAQVALASSSGGTQETFMLKQVNPGITIEGFVVFDIPKDATGLILKAHGGMTGKEIKLKVE
jgi:RNA polymerase subunit RPABC4/transcription elongation factor Spt4